jgi:hypothetical protein
MLPRGRDDRVGGLVGGLLGAWTVGRERSLSARKRHKPGANHRKQTGRYVKLHIMAKSGPTGSVLAGLIMARSLQTIGILKDREYPPNPPDN